MTKHKPNYKVAMHLRSEERTLRFDAETRGERTYATARPCKHHPASPRLVQWSYHGRCAECARLAALDQKLRRDLGDLY
jgi:hypothetical protein